MRKIILVVICTTTFLLAESQNTNPCGKSWTDWTSAFNFTQGEVFYRVEYPSKSCDCGWHYVQIKHTIPYKTLVYIALEGYDCNDRKMTMTFSIETDGGVTVLDRYNYHTFKKVTDVTRVEITYRDGTHQHRYVTTKSGKLHFVDGRKQ
jgi:hypothetical protein